MISKEHIQKYLELASDTKFLEMYAGITYDVADIFRKAFPGKMAVLIADSTTWEICGKELDCYLEEAHLKTSVHIMSEPKFRAELRFVDEVCEAIKDKNAIAIAVGAGAINDICKLASYRCAKQYMSFPTAASVDGYTAFDASMFVDGLKTSFKCPAPRAVLADTAILAAAPAFITAGGYADLAAKTISGAEWILGDFIGREPINPDSWHSLQDVLQEALSQPTKLRKADHNAMNSMFKALMLSGIAMQLEKSSRPASGTEHLFSHYLDMSGHTYNERPVSHGFQVGVGTLVMCRMFDRFLAMDFSRIDVDKLVSQYPSLEQEKSLADSLFKDFIHPDLGSKVVEEKYYTQSEVRGILNKIKANWPELRASLRTQVYPYKRMHHLLKAVGAPSKPSDIGLSRKQVKEILPKLRFMRNRVGLLDIAKMLGILDELIA